MLAFVRWKCQCCGFAGNAGSKELCGKCGAERGAKAGSGPGQTPSSSEPSASGTAVSSAATAAVIPPSKRARLADERDDFSTRYRMVSLPQPWLAAAKGSVIFRAYETVETTTGMAKASGQQPVAGFDFDGCLCVFARGANTSNIMQANNIEKHLVFSHIKDVLVELHKLGYRIVIFSNESLVRFKNPDPIREALLRKLARLDAFLEYVKIPMEVYLATHNDDYRKPSTADFEKGGYGGIAMWTFMKSDPLKLGKSAPEASNLGFYVGDAAGRPGDISDGDRRFALKIGLPFHTPEDFFLRDGAAMRLTGVQPFQSSMISANLTQNASVPPFSGDSSQVDLAWQQLISKASRPLLLVLSGLPGSGKSSLGQRLCEAVGGATKAARFSQDVLKSRPKVEQACAQALNEGKKLVIVDRTNLVPRQRESWLHLAKDHNADAALVFLEVHPLECVQRCQQRKNHEGNFPTARDQILNVVQRFASNLELPQTKEGFGACSVLRQPLSTDIAAWELAHNSDLAALVSGAKNDHRNASSPVQRPAVLAFSSISTGEFKFDITKAVGVMLRTISRCSQSWNLGPKTLRLVEAPGSPVLKALQEDEKLAAQVRLIPALEIVDGDITSQVNVKALAVGSIKRLTRPGENKSNVKIHAAINQTKPNQLVELLQGRTIAEVANPVALELPEDHPLRKSTSATHVLLTLGPNMNSAKDDSLADQPQHAEELLERCYLQLFETFKTLVASSPSHESAQLSEVSQSKKITSFPSKIDVPAGPVPPASRSWKHALKDYIHKPVPTSYLPYIYYQDSEYTVIYDAFPKARVHLLILPLATSGLAEVDQVGELEPKHIPAVEKLAGFAQQLASHVYSVLQTVNADAAPVHIGFHAVPSLHHLHVHVISQDFDSPCLKIKKHWNSFTQPQFFLPVDLVLQTLKTKGHDGVSQLLQHSEEALKAPLACHRCKKSMSNLQMLKAHIATPCE